MSELSQRASDAVFERAIRAHQCGDRDLRDACALWTYLVANPELTIGVLLSKISGLEKEGYAKNHAPSRVIAQVLRDVLEKE